MPTVEPAPKRSKFSLDKCPRQPDKGRLPDLTRMVQATVAPPLPPPDAVRALFNAGDTLWLGLDLETHRLVPTTADSWWRPGQFGFMTRLTTDVLAELRIVQVGWTIGTFDSAERTKERLVLPNGFEVCPLSTEKHGISHSQAVSQGVPLADCLRELVGDVSAVVQQGGRVCGHNLEFDAGIVLEELNRCGLDELAELWSGAIQGGFCSMDPDVGHWVRKQAGLADKERKTPMRLKDMVRLLLPDANALLEKHHSAGNDSRMHWLLCRELERRCRE